MRKFISVCTLVMMLGFTPVSVVLAGDWDRRDHMKDLGHMHMMKKLDLTEDQQTRFHELKQENQLEKIELKAAVRKAEVKLHGLQYDKESSLSDYNRIIDDLYDAKADLHKARVGFKMEMKELLTEEQRTRLKEMKKTFWKKKMKHHGDRDSRWKHRRDGKKDHDSDRYRHDD